MNAVTDADLAGALLDCLERHDTAGGVALALARLGYGDSVARVVAALATAQREVGGRWERDEWTVAQEHAATSTADRILAAVAAGAAEPVMYPAVLVVCAESEWHTLPARMFTDVLRSLRWDARFLGASVPAEHLRLYLEDERPFAMAVHCSVAMSLPGVVSATAAAHDAGVPVIAGGRAFGFGPRRAAAVDADGWAPDVEAADAMLHRWADGGVPSARPAARRRLTDHARLLERRHAVVELAEHELLEASRYLRAATPAQRVRTREDLVYLAAFVEAAVLTGDRSVLDEYLVWLVHILVSRNVPADVVPPTCQAVSAALHILGEGSAANLLAAAAAAMQAPITASR